MAINRPSESDSAKANESNVNIDNAMGWKYRRFFGLPYYASPQVQLVLVAFVCFLCPGMLTQHPIDASHADIPKACSTQSTA